MQRQFGALTVEAVQGDIADQPGFDAVVNAANAELRPGAGVAGALHRVAGPGLADECRPLAPIRPGGAVITSAHGLPNRFVIHCLGPVYGRDRPEDALLRRCVSAALDLAEANELESVAFPAISTGVFGYPIHDAASVSVGQVVRRSLHLEHVKRVRFVLWSPSDLEVFSNAITDVTQAEP